MTEGSGDNKPKRPGPTPGPAPKRRTGGLGLKRLGPGDFELAHPRCVPEMELDYEEGIALWREGDIEAARDALRYALQGCGDNIWVHVALGRIALKEFNDASLARGHFGYGYELAQRALPADFTGRLPPARMANQPLYDAIDGLATCYDALGKPNEAAALRAQARRLSGEDRSPRPARGASR